MHQDFKDMGCAITNKETDKNLSLIDEIGATFLRLAHYQHAQYTYNRCDSMGFVVWAELALVNYITESPAFYSNAKLQLTELVRQNYNHPSIIFWSVENEITLQAGPDPSRLIKELADSVKQLDPSRLNTVGSNASDNNKVNWYTESVAFNKYFGWYDGTANDFGAYADQLHSNFPNGIVGISEYGAGANVGHHEDNPAQPSPGGEWHPEEYQNAFHEIHWKHMVKRRFLWCKLILEQFDFAADNSNEGSQPGINDKGMVTHDRLMKKGLLFLV